LDKENNTKMPPLSVHSSLISVMDKYFNTKTERSTLKNLQQANITTNKTSTNKRLKILYVTFFEYPFTGGLAHYISSIKSGFLARGHKVDVIAPNHMPKYMLDNWVPKAASQARSLLKSRYGIKNEKLVKNLSFLHVFKLYLGKQNLSNYDIIHAQDLFAQFLLGDINQSLQKPLIFTPHGFFTKSRLTFKKMQKGSIDEVYFTEIEKQGIRAANRIITIANSFRGTLKEFGARDEQMVTVHTGIDYKPLPKKYNEEKLIITCVSRLSPRKGHNLLLEALALIKDQLANVEVWIVGDGVMEKKLKEKTRTLNLDNVVTFWGRRNDIANILAKSDIYVLATINDNFPISVLEAMFSEQAIITTTCGGIPEMISHQQTGILCKPGSVKQLAQSLHQLINDHHSRRVLARNAKNYALRHFTKEKMTSSIEKIYYSYV
jgi:glycosyltransferase involved in cell wall biosynthesis